MDFRRPFFKSSKMLNAINGIIGNVGNIANSFNYKKQENDLAIAQLNTQAIQAQTEANQPNKFGNTVIIVIAVIAVCAIGYFILKPKK